VCFSNTCINNKIQNQHPAKNLTNQYPSPLSQKQQQTKSILTSEFHIIYPIKNND